MKAILVIDMLNDFIYGNDLLINAKNRKKLIKNIKIAIDRAHKNKIPVIYVSCSHKKNHPCIKMGGIHAMRGTKEAEIIKELKPEKCDYIIGKISFDGFYKTKLEHLLKKLKVRDVYLAGVQTDCCIRETAVSAGYRFYNVHVIKNCCSTNKKWKEKSALDFMRSNGIKIENKFR